jgi:hypothetical protein
MRAGAPPSPTSDKHNHLYALDYQTEVKSSVFGEREQLVVYADAPPSSWVVPPLKFSRPKFPVTNPRPVVFLLRKATKSISEEMLPCRKPSAF